MKNLIYILFATVFVLNLATAQSPRKSNREGIEHYNQKDYNKAEEVYKKALKQNPNLVEASYNLTLAYYRQEKYNEVITQSKKVLTQTSDKALLGKLYHNLGNSYLQLNMLKESIDSYENSLRINPKDEETRYNLTYALLKYKARENKDKNTKDLLDKIQKEEDFSQKFMRRNKNRGKVMKNW